MKKILLSSMAAILLSMTAAAQSTWNEDPINGVNVWPDTNRNYGYTIATNKQGVTYAFFHGVGVNGMDYPMIVQVIDKNGNKLCEGDGLLLSNESNISYTKVNTDLTIDVEGNAFISVSDTRLGGEAYTIYKVGADGQLIWGGKTLNGGVLPGGTAGTGGTACMSICPTSDGGAIFAYQYYRELSSINVEKLDKDGNSVWTETLTGDEDHSYPYLIDAGDNQALLFFAQGTNQIEKIRMLDFDGSSAWGEDITVYSGGFGSMPLWVQFNTAKGPEGALAAWQNGDSNTGNYENRMAYILKDDGSFNFSDGEGGTIISNATNYSRCVPNFYFDEGDNAIYAVYRQYDQAMQSLKGIFIQKMSAEGELLWGPEGKAVIDIQQDYQLNNSLVRDAGDGKIAVFWQQLEGPNAYSGPVESMMVIYDKDGNVVQAPINFTTSGTTKNDLYVSELLNGDHYIVSWSENNSNDDYAKAVQIKLLYLDGSSTDVISMKDGTSKEIVRREIFNVTGERLTTMQKGVNIVCDVYADGTSNTHKIIVR